MTPLTMTPFTRSRFGFRLLASAVGLMAVAVGLPPRVAGGAEELVLADKGESLAPIVVFKDAPPATRRAAGDLASYIEQISGAKPRVIEGEPKPLPPHAIWVGYQPVLKGLFPDVDFEFTKPEEIVIAATKDHLVIAGRDRWDPGHREANSAASKNGDHQGQQEYGTANAVSTFLQDHLGVRWLWPGESGVDIVKQSRIALKPFAWRYHPRLGCRKYVMWWSNRLKKCGPLNYEWARVQRLNLDSSNLHEAPDGHAFGDWWGRFGKTHPEYFALQPNGTRDPMGGVGEGRVKVCKSNPAVWDQWLRDVEKQLEEDPTRTMFRAGPNDSNVAGYCICENCRAWDSPRGEKRFLVWEGLSQEYPALSDRQVRFANTLGRKLTERYPGKGYKVMMLAYGPSTPAPVDNKPDDNVVVLYTTNWFEDPGVKDPRSPTGRTWAEYYADWGATGAHLWLRPNLPGLVGQYQGLPDVAFTRATGYVKYVVHHGATGITLAHLGNFWRTQGPLYYLLAQLAWNPDLDGRQVLDDYYRRAFGPAAPQLEAYWTLLEQTRDRTADAMLAAAGNDLRAAKGKEGSHERFVKLYDAAFFAQASALLDEADRAVASGPDAEKYRRRIAGVRTGLDYTRKLIDIIRLMNVYNTGGEPRDLPALDPTTEFVVDPAPRKAADASEKPQSDGKQRAAEKVRLLWDELESLIAADPLLAGRSPYLWNGDLYPDKSYPYVPGGKRPAKPAK